MQVLTGFLIEPLNNKRYNNTMDIGGVTIYKSTSIEDHKSTNRFGKILSIAPDIKTNLSVGDTVVVHHNQFRQFYDQQGNLNNGINYLYGNKYILDESMIYMYSKDNGETWVANPPYIFVKPIKKENSFESFIKEEGIIAYTSHENLSIDDHVRFTADSECEFEINGEKLYRMKFNDVLWKN